MKKKSLLAVIMCVAMVFSTAAVYATDLSTYVTELGDTRMVTSGTISLTKQSSLRGKMVMTASFADTDYDYVKATVTVQRNGSNGWTQYYAPYDIYGDAEFGDMSIVEYIDVKVSGTYRVKVVFQDKKGTNTSTSSAYYSKAVSL